MLTFKSKEEEEFWKQVVIATASRSYGVASIEEADVAVEQLRLRQPVQQFPEVEK